MVNKFLGKVLVVEDDKIPSMLHCHLVRQEGFSPIVVASFESFQNMVLEDVFAIITDNEIPINQGDTETQPCAEKIIEKGLLAGISPENIIVVSSSMNEYKSVQVISKSTEYRDILRDFIARIKKTALIEEGKTSNDLL